MAIITETNEKLQKMMNIISEYCNYYRLSINFNEKDKTVYTTNNDNQEYKITFKNELNETKILIKLAKNKCYKYFRVYINLNLNWEKQHIISKTKLLRQLFFIEKNVSPHKQLVL